MEKEMHFKWYDVCDDRWKDYTVYVEKEEIDTRRSRDIFIEGIIDTIAEDQEGYYEETKNSIEAEWDSDYQLKEGYVVISFDTIENAKKYVEENEYKHMWCEVIENKPNLVLVTVVYFDKEED